MNNPQVAVLIPTLNNHKELEIVLKSLKSQTWKGQLEIAVVGPTNDPGKEITEINGATWIDDKGSRNRADACNIGIKEINCDILLFTDDDVIPPKDWVEKLVRWFERKEVAGVGGQNWAPKEDPFLAKVVDVAFGAKYVTAGTRYGKVSKGELIEIEHNPGCNSAYRKNVLDEVDGFESGCIGAEDVVLDHKIRSKGHKLWFDPESIMPHRRRTPPALFKQMKNYGYVRTLANSRWPELRSWSHLAIAMFPILVFSAILSIISSLIVSSINPSIYFQIPIYAAIVYVLICWLGSILGNSPHRINPFTIFFSPIMIFCAHYFYGLGVIKGLFQIYFGKGASAGLGIQLDDKKRN
ncbi:MAG: hypothetical protein CMA03_01160 [Euryarchaeota archaeon]|nr:hypothetical protein [Euryarchaeota archaeon]